MNSYIVTVTGKSAGKPSHIDITVDGKDEDDAKRKALVYLGKLYDRVSWHVDNVTLVTGPSRRHA
jgi:hypothetical protein